AFEQAGFINAIEVRQMPDDADWDPEDVRYNTVRWLTTESTSFAGIGPSRVNPLTGEILDADILIDGGIARLASSQVAAYFGRDELGLERMAAELLAPRSPASPASLTSSSRLTSALPIDLSQLQARCEGEQCRRLAEIPAFVPRGWGQRSGLSSLCNITNSQAAIGAMALPLLQGTLPYRENFDEYVRQYITHVVSHEVGHTLGLRHNFHGSTHLAPAELNNPAIVAERGLISSVMDYTPVNIAPPGVEQGEFYATEVGAYDRWAIEYGYRNFDNQSPTTERNALDAIANRAQARPDLSYGTDEDAWIGDDPAITLFDLSSDPAAFAKIQYDNARLMWDRLDSSYPSASGAAEELRERFDLILMYYFRQTAILLEQIGGQSFTRTAPETGDRRIPFTPIPRDQQLQSLDLVMDYIFAPDAFEFDGDLLNRLVPSRWSHWGMPWSSQLEYPAFDRISFIQSTTLASLLSPTRMEKLREIEFKSDPGTALTLPDLFDRLDLSIWSEIQAAIPSNITDLRRELQRNYVKLQIDMVLERTYALEDARTLTRRSLKRTRDRLETALNRSSQLDTYTQAHLEDTKIQIDQALNAVRLTDQPEFNPFSLFGF
ncbi:MAG: peptidase M43, partial [Coleofasciculaceae cyanobacterium RL_1_1]|nr:peptidase M43 [Coleofasciculaceae cyanobacterium RL_1_1]